MKILLGRQEVDPNRQNNDGLTPLMAAAEKGHAPVVKILLGRPDVPHDKPDNRGQTPLMSAYVNGHKSVVALLEQADEAKKNRK